MTELPRKITDDPYGAAILIRRLVMEQAVAYWRQYLLAFVAKPEKNAGMQSVKVRTDASHMEIASAERVFVPAR